jgi:hypothetical protein
MKTLVITAIMMALGLVNDESLVGKWETKPSPKGNVTGMVMRADNTFDVYINKKAFTSGKYYFRDGVLSFTDTGCDGSEGVYRIVFFSAGDSIRFQPISDTCTDRRNGMSRTVMGRVK